MSNALSAAFERVGIVRPQERLLRLAIEAWGKFPRENDGPARREHIADHMRGEMTYALIESWDRNVLGMAVGNLLNKARDAIERERPKNAGKPAGRGQGTDETQQCGDPANPPGAKPADDGGHKVDEVHALIAPVVTPLNAGVTRRSVSARPSAETRELTPAAPNLTELADKQAARMASRLATEVKLSKLDTFIINGRPIGECTPEEARGWASSRRRDALFVERLAANIPDGRPIREFVTGDEAEALYRSAEVDNAQ